MSDHGDLDDPVLAALACQLAAAVLAVRSEAVAVIAATRAASARVPVRAQREMRRRARLVRRARTFQACRFLPTKSSIIMP
jgi:hypothetical protein